MDGEVMRMKMNIRVCLETACTERDGEVELQDEDVWRKSAR
jgi:hypothetical protein